LSHALEVGILGHFLKLLKCQSGAPLLLVHDCFGIKIKNRLFLTVICGTIKRAVPSEVGTHLLKDLRKVSVLGKELLCEELFVALELLASLEVSSIPEK
jgi:hypothetical protein